MEKYFTFTKTNSSYRYGTFHVRRTDMWGNYCPETGEYYLACNDTDPIAGECIAILASGCYVRDDEWQEQSACGYSYEVVRELLQLGHLTKKTLTRFLEEGGEVCWEQPGYISRTLERFLQEYEDEDWWEQPDCFTSRTMGYFI